MKIKRLTLGGVMAALVFVMTYFPKVPVPVTGGYIHLGDGAIFLAGMLLGPLAVASAAIAPRCRTWWADMCPMCCQPW